MDKLPLELLYRIFSLLEHRPLATAARVCRSWRHVTDHAELWKRLYEKRWGQAKAAKVSEDLTTPRSWKAAYEAQDRWDRIGEEMTIVREGDGYFLTERGILLRCLGYRDMPGSTINRAIEGSSSSQAESRISRPGLVDRLFRVVADMGYEHRRVSRKRSND